KPHSPILADFTMFEGSKGRLENKTAKVWQGNAIELDPEERIYRLEVAQLDYFNSDKIIYNYRLDGRDRRWKSLRGNEIAIEGVTPGQYTLRVRARKTGYSFGDQELRIPLLRNVAFYRRPEFLTLLTLLCFGMIWWWQRLRNLRLQEQQAKLEREVQKRTLKIQEDKLLIEKQAEELREQDRLKTRFFNNIAHELRTPLTLISGPVRQLLQRSSVELEEQQLLQLIRQNSEHLLQKVKYMLDLAKLEAKQLELHPRQMDLRRFFEQQLSLFTSLARTQKIDLQLEQRYAGELWLLIDEEKLSTIVQNLLSNALKYTPSGGRVLLRWSTDAEQLMIEVIDSGGGIPAEDLPQVFNRFYQVRKTNREGDGGTGIGLALTRELVELMGGQIGVESSSETGSRFWIRLPLKVLPYPHAPEPVEEAFVRERPLDADEISDWQNQTKPTVPPVQAEALGTTPKKHRGNILLVEDNPELREYLGLVLADYHLVAVGDGQEALDWLSQTARLPRLIISDIMMPVMDGFTLLERLKAAERTSMIPVILLTARAEVKDRRRALRIGVDDYVTKPFVAQELLVKVETLLQHAGERKGSGEAVANVNQQRWLAELEQLLLDNLSTRNFTQDQMAAALHISKRQLSRRIKKLTGLTTNQYLREIRLHQARQLLEDGVYATIAEVSYAVGFEDQHYFSNLYFQRFAIKPIAYFTPSNEDAK
ncbi:MAG: ATP-binding protein, partial [Bacteroidota bacterium]